ncbi:MAG: glycosyltransferase family 39 protein [Stappiaceae bacterium]
MWSDQRQIPIARWVATPGGIALIVVLYGLVHTLLRVWASAALGTDDDAENVWVQTLEFGYILAQPPLYEWLLYGFQQIFGPTIQSILALKYTVLTGTSVFLFLAARYALSDPRLAALCVLSYSLLIQIGWNLFEGVTHTNVLMCSCAATAWLFVRALRTRALADYALLGIAVGCGLVAKFSYPLFPLALMIGCLSLSSLRQRLRVTGLMLTLIVALCVISPFAYWIISGDHSLFGAMNGKMTGGGATAHWERVAIGLPRFAFSLFGFSALLVPVLVLMFYQPLRRGNLWLIENVDQAETAQLFGRTVAVMIGLAAIGIIASGSIHVKERHMHPILLLLPIYLFARMEAGKAASFRYANLLALIVIVVVVAFVARIPTFVAPTKSLCGKCREMKPYMALKPALEKLGFEGGTLIGADTYTAGNLRVAFPNARISDPRWTSPKKVAQSACYLVWDAGEEGPKPLAQVNGRFAKATEDTKNTPQFIDANWPMRMGLGDKRVTTFGILSLAPDNSLCR